jgi:hypothetical protein
MNFMQSLLMPLRRLVLQFLLLLVLFFLSRTAFALINYSHFEGLGLIGFLRLAFFGLRYDLSALCALNSLYLLLLILPGNLFTGPKSQKFLNIIFIGINSFALLFEIADWAYYPYNFKRATADVLRMVTRKGDFWSVLPSYVISFWYVPLAMVAFIYLLVRNNKKICCATPISDPEIPARIGIRFIVQTVIMALTAGIFVIGIRGGLQYIPMGLRNAVQVTDSRYVPVLLNTPFSIITTLTTPSLDEVDYMPEAKAEELMPFLHQYPGKEFRPKNVVMIILESGSKEFTSLGRKSFMPFLDSLMGLGLNCTQAFANGQTSAEGIPAILAGMPTLMEEAFITSNYGTNRISALPGLLKSHNYSSAFFHGGTNGTMSFDVFSDAAGFDHYFGRTEYGNEADYDGAWGIRDMPFMQFALKKMNALKPPFFASVFTLSAHPPYKLPDDLKNQLPKGTLEVEPCIAYTDLALRKFFENAAGELWYDSTLFIITADHCSPENGGGFYSQGLGRYAIPLVFYAPGDNSLKGIYDQPVQQLDILPSLLQYLGYSDPFFAFGNSIFSKNDKRFVITYNSGFYQWLENGFQLQAAAMKPSAFFVYPQDSLNAQNLLSTEKTKADSSLKRLEAFVQRYRSTLIHNTTR